MLSVVLGYYIYREIVVSQQTILARDLGTDTISIDPGDVAARSKVSEQIDREFNDALQTKLRVVVSINNAPSGSTANLYEDNFQDEVTQKTWVLFSALGVFLAILALVWVYLTHRIAGPVFKLRLLFGKVTADNLQVVGRLRKGDELQEAFISFRDMVERVRVNHRAIADRIAIAANDLRDEDATSTNAVEVLDELEKEMRASLGDD